MTSRPTATLVALFLAALTLRPQIVGIGPFEVPFGRFAETIRIREFDPLTGDKDHKIHAAGFGIIVDGPLQLVGINQTTGAPPLPTLTVQSCGQ